MTIIHGMLSDQLPRLVLPSLAQRLRVMPAVVVTGARQTGKSTLAHELTPGDRRYLSLDDLDVHDLARRDLTSYWRVTSVSLWMRYSANLTCSMPSSAPLTAAANPAGFCSQGLPTCF